MIRQCFIYKSLLLVVTMLLVASCSTVDKVTYLQDIQPNVSMALQETKKITLEKGDKISIVVHGRDEEVVKMFNLTDVQSNSTNMQSHSYYTVDDNGQVDIPILGLITVSGLTRQDVANTVKYRLLSGKLVRDPTVTVDFVNLSFAVMGEVNSPGRKSIERDQITLLEALTEAGDLTIQGRRDNVLVLRTEKGRQTPYRVDLTQTNALYSSPVFYVKQNDIIYVGPTDVKANQSTQNGNTLRTPTFWMSTISALATLSVLITK